jgi:hypothetical protein
MRIKILAITKEQFPTPGPYKTIDIVENEALYQVGDTTHYGEVILIVPPALLDDSVKQGVVVKLDPASLGTWCEESVMEKPPTSYDKIQFFPISVSFCPHATLEQIISKSVIKECSFHFVPCFLRSGRRASIPRDSVA